MVCASSSQSLGAYSAGISLIQRDNGWLKAFLEVLERRSASSHVVCHRRAMLSAACDARW